MDTDHQQTVVPHYTAFFNLRPLMWKVWTPLVYLDTAVRHITLLSILKHTANPLCLCAKFSTFPGQSILHLLLSHLSFKQQERDQTCTNFLLHCKPFLESAKPQDKLWLFVLENLHVVNTGSSQNFPNHPQKQTSSWYFPSFQAALLIFSFERVAPAHRPPNP